MCLQFYTSVYLHVLCPQSRIPLESPNLSTYCLILLLPGHFSEFSSKSPLKETFHDPQIDQVSFPLHSPTLPAPMALIWVSACCPYYTAGTRSFLTFRPLGLALNWWLIYIWTIVCQRLDFPYSRGRYLENTEVTYDTGSNIIQGVIHP